MAVVLNYIDGYGSVSQREFQPPHLGENMRQPYLLWGLYGGLLQHREARGEFELSVLGQQVLKHDPTLANPQTLWLIHYHLSNATGPAPQFWQEIVVQRFSLSIPLSIDTLQPLISSAHGDQHAATSVRKTAGVFLTTYADRDSLGGLGLLLKMGSDSYLPNAPSHPVNPATFLYAIQDYWRALYPERDTMPLDELYTEAGPAQTLLLQVDEVDSLLGELRHKGLLDVFRAAPPYQLVRFWPDEVSAKAQALELVYSNAS